MRNDKLHLILKETFGYQTFRFDQLEIINSILDGKDTLAIMPTGGGKSLCYQIPALYSEGVCLVISPLISLMQDQVMNLEEFGVASCFLNSSQSYEEKKEVQRRVRNGEAKILYVSPEGVLSPSIMNFLDQITISLIAIDEAHCVSQWGHEFRKDYTRLYELKNWFPEVPLIALTATADEKTRRDISHQLSLKDPQTFVSSFDRPNIKYMIHERGDEIKQLNEFISASHSDDTGIVYCLSRKKVEKVAKELSNLGYHAIPYHAGLSPQTRERNQELFNREEQIIVVATIAFGMGIDRPDVRFVAHLDLPKSVESYYQETGRAGRDGKESSAWMIYGLQDVVKISQMLETTEAHENYKKVARHKLDSMLSLCETIQCRRHYLLNYFGEQTGQHCGSCDSCLEPAETWDASIDAQKLLSTIYRTGQNFGSNYIIDVLRGSKNTKVIERRHDRLSVYGIGKDLPKNHWNHMIRQMIHLGYIGIKNWEYRNLCLLEKSRGVLAGTSPIYLRRQSDKRARLGLQKASTKNKHMDHERHELFEELRSLRGEIAEEKKVPPYIVFNDKTLHEMCVFLPRNASDFLMINGVGQKKYEQYGALFLRKIADHQIHV